MNSIIQYEIDFKFNFVTGKKISSYNKTPQIFKFTFFSSITLLKC